MLMLIKGLKPARPTVGHRLTFLLLAEYMACSHHRALLAHSCAQLPGQAHAKDWTRR